MIILNLFKKCHLMNPKVGIFVLLFKEMYGHHSGEFKCGYQGLMGSSGLISTYKVSIMVSTQFHKEGVERI